MLAIFLVNRFQIFNLIKAFFYKGSRPPGEYFNPGYDCLDILTQNPKAKDGYYWVDFHRSVPHKVIVSKRLC